MCIYDRQGRKINPVQWMAAPDKERRIKHQVMVRRGETLSVLTTWMGLDNDCGAGPGHKPLIFDTDVIRNGTELVTVGRWATEAEARAGHKDAVAVLKRAGWRTGLRATPYWMRRGVTRVPTVKMGVVMTTVWSLAVLLQLASITFGMLNWSFSWGSLVGVAVLAFDAWMLQGAVAGLREQLELKAREKQAEEDRAKFDEIVKHAA